MEKNIIKLNYIEKRIHSLISINKVIAIHYFEFNPSFCAEMEIHHFWEFVYVDKGVIVTTVNGEDYTLSQSDYIFYKPGDCHSLRSHFETSPNVFLIVFICHSAAMRIFQNRRGTLPVYLRKYIAEVIREARQTYQLPFNDPYMVELLSKENEIPGGQQLVKINMEQLLIYLYRDLCSSQQRPSASALLDQNSIDNAVVKKMVDFIHENLYSDITAASVCSISGYSVSYASTLFRGVCGCNIIEYMNMAKITEAKNLIRQGNLNFAQIAEQLGFSNQHYFSRVFRRVAKMSPSEYRYSTQL